MARAAATGGLIEAMAEAVNDAQQARLARGPKHDFEQHLALDLQAARFISVDRARLGNDFHRGKAGRGGGFSCRRSRDGHRGVGKPAGVGVRWRGGRPFRGAGRVECAGGRPRLARNLSGGSLNA